MAIGHQHWHHHHHFFDGFFNSKHAKSRYPSFQVKLDELIRATQGAHNALLDLEELEEETLDAFRLKYQALASAARTKIDLGILDTDSPEP